MTDKAISPLRRRLIEDMTIRRLGPGTQHQYIRHVKSFADFVCRSPEKATPEDVRRYQLRLLEQKTDIRIIQVLLGHKKLDTTALYTRVAINALGEVTSPLDFLLKMPG